VNRTAYSTVETGRNTAPTEIKSAIITGATGPLGIALIGLLIKKGINVTIIARKSSGRFANIPKNKLVRVMEADLSQLNGLESKLNKSYDVFYHFGWINTANRDERNDTAAQLLNVQYALDAVWLAKKLSCLVFIGAGSQSEYGEYNGLLSETTLTNPDEAYGVAKLAALGFCKILCNQLGIRFGWLRLLSVYGPYDRDSAFIPYCASELLRGRTPNLTPCEQIWDFIYSKDAAEAFWLLAEKGKPDAVYPLASGEAKSLRQYAEILRDLINPALTLNFGGLSYPKSQRMHLAADIGPLKRDLGFVPEYSFERGITETVEFIRRRMQDE
jgi:nucleoside-diphosphate-sugar epimerase